MISSQKICIKDEQIKVVHNWLELQSVQDIQVFLGFANFYQFFIQSFSQIATLFTSMLKTTRVKLSVKDLVPSNENITVDKVGNKIKVGGTKF